MSTQLQQAITLIKSGKKQDGQQILLQTLKQEPENEKAWLWMSTVVNENKRRYCLKQALNINPNNQQAKQVLARLDQLEAKPVAPSPTVSSQLQANSLPVDTKLSEPVATPAQPSAIPVANGLKSAKLSEPSPTPAQPLALVTELDPFSSDAPLPPAAAKPAAAVSEPDIQPTFNLRSLSDLVDTSAPEPSVSKPDVSQPDPAESDVDDLKPKLWINPEKKNIYITVLFDKKLASGILDPAKVKSFQTKLQRGTIPIDMLTSEKTIAFKQITEVSQTMSSLRVHYREANTPKSTRLECKDDEMAGAILTALQKRLGSKFKRTSTPVSRGLIATMSSIVMAIFLGITTFFYYAAVEATTDTLVSTGSSRTRGLAALLGLLGPTGVACIGGALFLLILIVVIFYMVNPPLTTTLAPKKVSAKRSKK